MTDLTKITTPFGLLDNETQKALIAHSGEIEVFDYYGRWGQYSPKDYWQTNSTYRVKPTPPKPRECWSYGTHRFSTLADAEKHRADVNAASPGKGYGDWPITHWVEVLP